MAGRKVCKDGDIEGILGIEREGSGGGRVFRQSGWVALIVREIVDQSRAAHTGILGEEIGQKEH